MGCFFVWVWCALYGLVELYMSLIISCRLSVSLLEGFLQKSRLVKVQGGKWINPVHVIPHY